MTAIIRLSSASAPIADPTTIARKEDEAEGNSCGVPRLPPSAVVCNVDVSANVPLTGVVALFEETLVAAARVPGVFKRTVAEESVVATSVVETATAVIKVVARETVVVAGEFGAETVVESGLLGEVGILDLARENEAEEAAAEVVCRGVFVVAAFEEVAETAAVLAYEVVKEIVVTALELGTVVEPALLGEVGRLDVARENEAEEAVAEAVCRDVVAVVVAFKVVETAVSVATLELKTVLEAVSEDVRAVLDAVGRASEVVEGEAADVAASEDVRIAVTVEEVLAVMVETVTFTLPGVVVGRKEQVPSILPLAGGEKVG